jgi:hypothetical protein
MSRLFYLLHVKNFLWSSTKKVVDIQPTGPYNYPIKTRKQTQKGKNYMTAYTDKMVLDMTSTGSFTYETATAFADLHGLSVRSVISKVKNLGLPYTPKESVKSTSGPRITKADIVRLIADASGADPEALAGLDKADVGSLRALLAALPS